MNSNNDDWYSFFLLFLLITGYIFSKLPNEKWLYIQYVVSYLAHLKKNVYISKIIVMMLKK